MKNKRYKYQYIRNIKTTQERRAACDPDHKDFVRKKRNHKNLPDTYDDPKYNYEKSWKRRRKQKYVTQPSKPRKKRSEVFAFEKPGWYGNTEVRQAYRNLLKQLESKDILYSMNWVRKDDSMYLVVEWKE